MCKKLPLPTKDGEGVAVMSMAAAYAKQGCTLDLLSFNTSKHFVADEVLNQLKHPYREIKDVYLDTSIKTLSLIRDLVLGRSHNIQRFINGKFKAVLIDMLKSNSYDFVQLESLYMAPYIDTVRKYSSAVIVMRSHNLEYQIWEELSLGERNPIKAVYFKICGRQLKSYEQRVYSNYDLLLPISKEDARLYRELGFGKNMLLTLPGLELNQYPLGERKINIPLRIGYLGSLDWKPNIEGLLWFFEKVWPVILKHYPQVVFHLAGRNPSDDIRSIKLKGLKLYGEVEDAMSFLKDMDLIVVPLFSGSGIRIKILESMALGKTVLSTEKGFESIDIENGINALMAKDANDFIEQLREVLDGHYQLDTISRNARQFIETNFDNSKIAERVLQLIKQLKL